MGSATGELVLHVCPLHLPSNEDHCKESAYWEEDICRKLVEKVEHVVSKNLEVYPGADKHSIMLTTPHRPGSLYSILGKFYGLGINLLKLESRPIPDKDFEFMFYFDLKSSVYSDEFKQLIIELQQVSDDFRYLGSYTEVIE